MRKNIVNYIFVCLVILIVTSLLYIINNDIKEYVIGDNNLVDIENNFHRNLDLTVSHVENNRLTEADSIYTLYWNHIKNVNSDGVNKLNGCGSKFSSFMYNIKDKVEQQFQDSDLCKKFTDNDYTTLDLNDSGKSGRIKANCLKEALNNNEKGLNKLMTEYKPLTTPLDRCGYLKDNGY